jgi:hypothetical protein
MLVDVGDPARNLILNACFYGIVLVMLLSLVPWRLKEGRNRWSLYLPVAAIAIYVIYEAAMPPNWDIRIDLLLLAPMGLVIILAWGIRLMLRVRSARS